MGLSVSKAAEIWRSATTWPTCFACNSPTTWRERWNARETSRWSATSQPAR